MKNLLAAAILLASSAAFGKSYLICQGAKAESKNTVVIVDNEKNDMYMGLVEGDVVNGQKIMAIDLDVVKFVRARCPNTFSISANIEGEGDIQLDTRACSAGASELTSSLDGETITVEVECSVKNVDVQALSITDLMGV